MAQIAITSDATQTQMKYDNGFSSLSSSAAYAATLLAVNSLLPARVPPSFLRARKRARTLTATETQRKKDSETESPSMALSESKTHWVWKPSNSFYKNYARDGPKLRYFFDEQSLVTIGPGEINYDEVNLLFTNPDITQITSYVSQAAN